MLSNMISWRDEDLQGFGSATGDDLGNLHKALTAGAEINPPSTANSGDGFALRIESLDQTLRNVTFRAEHIVLFKLLPKIPAFNTVEEFNQILEYGEDLDGFIEEGGLPNETDSTYERNFSVIKYVGTTRRVRHPMTLVRAAHGNVVAQETVNGTMKLLSIIERALIYGDASVDALQWDGFQRLIEQGPSTGGKASPTANVIDRRGAPLDEDVLIDGSLIVSDAPNYGRGTHLLANPRNHSDLVKSFLPKARYDLLQKRDDGLVGLDVGGYVTPAGNVAFAPNTFIQPGRVVPTTSDGKSPPPAATSLTAVADGVSVPTKARADGIVGFTDAEAGVYAYHVVAVAKGGKSIPTVNTAAATVTAANDRVALTIVDGAGSPTPRYYEIYRTAAGQAASTARLVDRVKRDSSGSTTYVDGNANLPGTSIAILFQMNLEAVSFKQLSPMVKIPISIVDTSIRWMQLLYGTPVLYTPGKILLYKNIGRASGSV